MKKKAQTFAVAGLLLIGNTVGWAGPVGQEDHVAAKTVLPDNVPGFTPVPIGRTGSAVPPPIPGEDGGLSWYDERRIGDQVAYEIQKDIVYERDIVLHDYVNGLWQQLLTGARRNGELGNDLYRQMAWKMFLIRDPTVNAFALPGAYIGVNLGLISVVNTRDELASVLAHETVHIVQRHIARMYGKNSGFNLLSLASLLVGAIAASANPQAGIGIMAGGTALAVQKQIDFTRAMEYEADRIGYRVLVDSGFRPQGMADMFRILQQAMRYSDASFPYLYTHPLDNQRIAEAQTRVGIAKPDSVPPPDYEQAMMGVRARVLANPNPEALRALISSAKAALAAATTDGNPPVGALYGGAMAAMKLRQFNDADQLLARLQEQVVSMKDPKLQRLTALLGAEAALAQGQVQKAQQWLQSSAPMATPDLLRSEKLYQAQVDLAAGRADTVISTLQPWTVQHADDETAWQILSSAYSITKQPILALRAEGEMSMARMDYGGAIDRFKAALNLGRSSRNIDDLEIVQSRLKAAEMAQQELKDLKF